MLHRRPMLAGVVAGLMLPRAGFAACSPALATVPVRTGGSPCVVSVALDGRVVAMVLDTGAERTILTRAAVAQAHVPLDPWVGTTLRGAGGRLDQHQNAVPRSISLGGVSLYQRGPGVPLSLPVTALELGEVAGLLGGDLLSHTTLDLDAQAGRLSLQRNADCVAADAEAVSFQLLRRFLILVPVRLDGHDLTAMVDTGASRSLLNARGLHKIGLSAERLASDPTVSSAGIGGNFAARQHGFNELRIGRRVFRAPHVLIAEVPEPAFDMVLGMDVLGQQRVVISYATSRLFL